MEFHSRVLLIFLFFSCVESAPLNINQLDQLLKDIESLAAKDAKRLTSGDAQRLASGDAQRLASGDAQRLASGDAQRLASGDAQRLASGDAQRLASGDAQQHKTSSECHRIQILYKGKQIYTSCIHF
ncbi:uncharacterized protein LOC130623961 [Hydractinia symbiolongicarpus]|uniref:uncharacterized protein LOC130623961 n=1 Tax=Hydractinia symbiolongicarpus TaxID=13093 RepID=UPI00254AA046|nr:uncharacterized protein LOC130623961 [Hydractinia symbiolongicarpus]